jgi:hypothetical protein
METLVVAYLVGWAATAAYLGWLAVQNAKLAKRQQELKSMLQERDSANHVYSNAA